MTCHNYCPQLQSLFSVLNTERLRDVTTFNEDDQVVTHVIIVWNRQKTIVFRKKIGHILFMFSLNLFVVLFVGTFSMQIL